MFGLFVSLFIFFSFANQIYCESSKDLSEATAKFTLELLKHSDPLENVFISPASISTCLGMVYAGSNGVTKEEINKIAYGGLQDAKIYGDIKSIAEKVSNLSSGYTFNVANRVYSTKDADLLGSFKLNLANNFKSDIIPVDFAQSEAVRRQINQWVQEKTREMIKDLLPQESIDGDTKIVLVNALHFKGDWMYKFLANETKETPFFTTDNQQFNVPMMEMRSDKLYFGRDEDFKVLGLPFKNETMFMYLLLPHQRYALNAVEGRLNETKLLNLFNKAQKVRTVHAKIPKFKLKKSFKLKVILEKMNITSIFGPTADLSGMFGAPGLYISGAFHKAAIEVNEEGSEAAAATGFVGATRSMSSPPEFIADHPFLFAIFHRETKAILFFGRFVNNKFT